MTIKWFWRFFWFVVILIAAWWSFVIFVMFKLSAIKPEEVEGFKKIASMLWQWATSVLF